MWLSSSSEREMKMRDILTNSHCYLFMTWLITCQILS